MALSINRKSSLSEQLQEARSEMDSMRNEAGGIASDLQRLVALEVELAQAEIQEAKGHATKGTIFGVMAAEYAMLVSLFLLLATMFALDTAVQLWAAALITTAIALVVAAVFGLMAKKEWSSFSPMPKRAIHTMKEDLQWAKSQIKSSAK